MAFPCDVDMDGDQDVLVTEWGQCSLLINDGTGHFVHDPTRLPAQLSLSHRAAFGDLDEDGDPDLVIANGAGEYAWYFPWVYLNDGRGRFRDATASRMGSLPPACVEVALADLDGDRDLDIVFGLTHDRGNGTESLLFFTNRLRQVEAPPSVRVGTPWAVQVWGRPGFAGGTQFAFPFADTRLLRTPLRLPFGTIFLGPGMTAFPPLAMLHPAGVGTAYLPVPAAAHLIGQTAYMQAVVIHDPVAFGTTQLGAARITP